MIEDLKKLLPREKENKASSSFNQDGTLYGDEDFGHGYNQALAEVTACLPSLVEAIYADLTEKVIDMIGITTDTFCDDVKYLKIGGKLINKKEYLKKIDILSLLTPNKK